MERDHEMPYDADLLGQVIEDHNLPAKRLACLCSINPSTLYRYLSGEKTLPSKVLRAAFEETGDIRLLSLITGRRVLTFKPVLSCSHTNSNGSQSSATSVRIPPVDELMSKLLESIQNLGNAAPYMGVILKDHKVDRSDRRAKDNFTRHASDCRRNLALAEAALEAHMEKGTA